MATIQAAKDNIVNGLKINDKITQIAHSIRSQTAQTEHDGYVQDCLIELGHYNNNPHNVPKQHFLKMCELLINDLK